MLTVIIATFNRSGAVRDISLPSLLRQDTADFEVLIWDASEDGLTEKAASEYAAAFRERGVDLRYRRAPRRGLPSQRNDAVKAARGDIIFFIDDDSEVSPDGISVLTAAFGKDARLKGAGLPLVSKLPAPMKERDKGLARRALDLLRRFLWRGDNYRRVRNSTINTLPHVDLPGRAECLNGGDMAYRRDVFDVLEFDKRLERFGGYALAEDVDFSHRVMLHYRAPLLVTEGGQVTHHSAGEGDRPDKVRRTAAFFYNFRIMRDNFRKYDQRYNLPSFLWEHHFLMTINLFRLGTSLSEIAAGYREYRRAWRELIAAGYDDSWCLLK